MFSKGSSLPVSVFLYLVFLKEQLKDLELVFYDAVKIRKNKKRNSYILTILKEILSAKEKR